MKGLFPEYENSRAVNYDAVWGNALFVFDTNVLLNLYRYRVGTRDELLTVLDKIGARIWIPYQVALEFQRNRLAVIGEQVRRFSEVKRTVEKAKTALTTELTKLKLLERHSLINPEPLVSGYEKLTQTFFDELEKLEKDQQTISGEDQLKNRLEELFDGRVGPAFTKQEQLDALHKEGEVRYKFRIPPGFEDDPKDSREPDEFMHAGLIYKRKYGDFIIWKQMIEHCKKTGTKSLIFVTDDAKEDWWRVLDIDGPKTVGPRAELIDEARRVGKIEYFLMYSPSKFLANAKGALKAPVSDDAIQEVKDISSTGKSIRQRQMIETAIRGSNALRDWLLINSESVLDGPGKSTVTAFRDGERYTYVIAVSIPAKNSIDLYERTENLIESAVFGSPDGTELGHLVVVWLATNPSHAASIRADLRVTKSVKRGRGLGVDVIVATLDDPETLLPGFFVQWVFTL
jgi:predicted nucleic acid-binding protein